MRLVLYNNDGRAVTVWHDVEAWRLDWRKMNYGLKQIRAALGGISSRRQPRFPFEPLLRAAECRTLAQLADQSGVDRRRVYESHHSGGATAQLAERITLSAGLDPADVWPDWPRRLRPVLP